MRIKTFSALKAEQLNYLPRPFFSEVRGNFSYLQRKGDVVPYFHPGEKRMPLGKIAYPAGKLFRGPSCKAGQAGIRGLKPRGDPEHRGFPRARRPHKACYFSRQGLEREAVKGRKGSPFPAGKFLDHFPEQKRRSMQVVRSLHAIARQPASDRRTFRGSGYPSPL